MAAYDSKVIGMRKQGKSYKEIADTLQITEKQVNHAVHRFNKKKKGNIEYENRRVMTEDSLPGYIKAMKDLKTRAESTHTRQVKATVRLEGDLPVGIAYWSDWHIGALGVDYDLFEEDLRKIRDTEGLYFIGGGDYVDNYLTTSHRGSQFEQIIQPGAQNQVAKFYIKQVRDKAIALIRGCHDDWLTRETDRDYMEELCAEEVADAVNLWHGGEVIFKIGDQEYLWRCRHKYKYQSSLNLENAMRRINEIQGPCDVAAEAHLHNGYTMQRHLMGEYRVMLRSGSYKVWDQFAQKIGGYKGKPGIPVVIMFPDKREVVDIMGLDRAIKVLRGVRGAK